MCEIKGKGSKLCLENYIWKNVKDINSHLLSIPNPKLPGNANLHRPLTASWFYYVSLCNNLQKADHKLLQIGEAGTYLHKDEGYHGE